ncbi:hypothetical protein HK104_003544 [Borealophlyctis nickersoniae]|nr:hypothetical protein HK104_003544 [Borealophlyctis nickersoniae]
MEKTSSGFYVIDVLSLKHPSGKPHHLEARLSSRSTRSSSLSKGLARRAAFLEDRRSKLARRTSHVRDVCAAHRRTANAPRGTQSIETLSERLRSAERNRNTILERRGQSCAQQVARAKAVAKAQSQRDQESAATRRAALEQRLRATSARRQRLLTIPRSRLLESHLWDEPENENVTTEASITIQQWWRRSKMSPCVKNWSRFGLSLAKANEMSFERLVRLVKSDQLIRALGRILLRVKKMVGGEVAWKNPSRVFLSAYMIVAHPNELMPNIGPEEEALRESAVVMLVDFESWIDGFGTEKSYTLSHRFIDSWTAFYAAFEAWKSQDSRKIVESMVAHWIELERLWLSVKEQVGAHIEFLPRIEEQQKEIAGRLQKFGPDALAKLEQARASLLDTASFGRESPEEPSRTTLSTSPKRFPANRFQRKDSVAPTSIDITPAGDSVRSTDDPKLPPTPSAEAPDVRKMVSGYHDQQLSNEQLAHELVMDPDFQLKPAERSPLEEQVREMAKKAFFDSVRREFGEGKFEYVVGLIADAKQSLLSMVSDKGKIALEINEALDLDHIKQQIDNNAFDVVRCVAYIQQKMLQLCAPIRDVAVRSIAQQTDLATAFEIILTTLDDMKLDLANYRLQTLRPHLTQQAAEYERKKFEEALASGHTTLTRTRAWLTTSVQSLTATLAARNPENISIPENRVKFQDVYTDSLLSLIFSSTAVSPATCPETFYLDTARLYDIQNQVQAATIVAALLTLTKTAVPSIRDDRPALVKLKETLYILLKDPGTNIDNLALAITSVLPTPATTEQTTTVKAMVDRTLSHKDPVYSLLSRRIMGVVKTFLDKGVVRRDGLARMGLDLVGPEVEGVAVRVGRLAKFNREVYAGWYDGILREVV